ncbi:MAG: class I SAM-dependent methyltransferase [Actinobacteria bacterium]|nr:class I SAM-dependent methyltransferase [Actinomycetota bacterium]
MGHDAHRHERDKGLRAKLHWLFQIRQFWQSDVNREVLEMAAPTAGEHAVDIGAGMGPATVLAARRGARVTAVDPSRFMRTILSIRRPFQRARSRITVADGVAESLPVADGSVDVLWTVNAIHHWVDLEAAFDELARVLAPGGRIVLMDEDFTHPDHSLHASHHDHEAETTIVDVDVIAASLTGLGLAATGERTVAAGVPVKLIRATKPT